jgi:hypothetical protein
MRKLLGILFCIVSINVFAQNVGIGTNTPDSSAALHISDTSKGILIPRMTMNQRLNIHNPAEGLMVYQTDSVFGFWYFAHGEWQFINSKGNQVGFSSWPNSSPVNLSIGSFNSNGNTILVA